MVTMLWMRTLSSLLVLNRFSRLHHPIRIIFCWREKKNHIHHAFQMHFKRLKIYHTFYYLFHKPFKFRVNNELEWKLPFTEQRNWCTTANRREGKWERTSSWWGLGLLLTYTCLYLLDEQSPGHMLCYLRASALIRNPSAY